jgi:hypothetical protein
VSKRFAFSLVLTLVVMLTPSLAVGNSPAPGSDLRPSTHESTQLFALIIGCNTTHDPDVPMLRYADDDAIQNAKLLGQLGAEVVLLMNPDKDSRALHPDLQATKPTKVALLSAMVELNRRMQEARAQGKKPVFYFFYSGHGDVKNNQGQVTLEDSVLSRDEFIDLLKSSSAAVNHVVIDACKSYFFVFERGSSGSRTKVRGSLADPTRAVPPNTGIFLSTSAATDSHEWEAFQGGVFSHEMRSALRGAADANSDEIVTYTEAAGFIWNANRAIPSQRYRPHFFFRPATAESENNAILADLRIAKGDRFVIQPGTSRRSFVEDGLGTRYLDVHPGKTEALQLLLPTDRPLFVRWPSEGLEAEIPPGNPIQVASLATRSIRTLVRGAEHVAFGRLFSLPFDQGSITAFHVRPAEEDETVTSTLAADWTWPRRGLGFTALAVGVTGGVLTVLANREQENVRPTTSGTQREQVNHRIDGLNTAAVTCYAVAGAAAIGYLVWTLWPNKLAKIHIQPPVASAGHVRLGVAW